MLTFGFLKEDYPCLYDEFPRSYDTLTGTFIAFVITQRRLEQIRGGFVRKPNRRK